MKKIILEFDRNTIYSQQHTYIHPQTSYTDMQLIYEEK